ncbi:hypothetical protein [Leptonema illini]|uniref:Uncharacterized protein n=1 Tax=Leptonema illini DSM 21528 TaxID=929563 RepID=H2CKI6_9LEPT|nr:hypothetical protein [Leptonema illini]EHQ08291.1 hypothetical protein Lepil_3634 [Leptonema illini DSM 21528]
MRVRDEVTGRVYEAAFRSDLDPRGVFVLALSSGERFTKSQVLHLTVVEESEEEARIRKGAKFKFQG